MKRITEEFFNDVRDTVPSDLVVEFSPIKGKTDFKMIVYIDDDIHYVPFMEMQMSGFKTGKEFWEYVVSGLKSRGYM